MSRLFSIDREEKGFFPEGNNVSHHPQPPPLPDTGPGTVQFQQPQQPPPSLPFDERDRISNIYDLHQTQQLIPSHNKLLIFRSLTGIDSVPVLSRDGFFTPRNAPNVGIYVRVVEAEQAAAKKYRVFSLLINACLGLQIIVAAALTAIGAANGPHGAVTAFGAINTIMAGILTYLRGSGLPNKEKNIEKAWSQIREYIEQREREFCLESCMLNVEDEIHNIERMYEEVRSQMEIGASDTGGSRGGIDALSSLRPRGNLLEGARSAAHSGLDAVRGAISAHRDHTEHHLRDDLRNIGQHFQSARGQTEHNVRDQVQNLEHRFEGTRDQTERQLRGEFQNVGQRFQGTRDQIRDTSDQIRNTSDQIRGATEDIRQTGENLRQTEEQLLQAGDNRQHTDMHVSLRAPSITLSKHTQTDS